MKKILYLICLVPVLALGQSQDQNYIKTTTYKTATSSILSSPALSQAVENVTYFDGLGRPIQQVAKGQSVTGKNIITPMEYDAYGRQPKEYLPYASQSTGLNYEPAALTEVLNYLEYQGQNPWSEKLFEASPLNRVLKQSAPGNATTWAMGYGKEIKLDYQANGADEVKLFKATATWNAASGVYDIALTNSGTSFYTANQLYKSVTKDENWTSGTNGTTEEFKDKEGRVILKRTYNNTAYDTYYVYDQYGNLTYVIPPAVTAVASELDGYCYQYKYDYRNRMAEKKLPGKQWEFIVYDRLDRVVATGPAYSPFSDFAAPNNIGWLVTKYDAFNRVAYAGWMPSTTVTSAGRNQLQDDRNGQTSNFSETKIPNTTNSTVNGIDFRYTNVAWPTAGYHVLSVNYYDDYNYPNAPTAFDPVEGQSVYYNGTIKPKGLPTGTWTRVLENSALNIGELSYNLYDSKSRAVRAKTINHLGGHTTVDSKLDFSGKALYSITKHSRAGGADLYIKDSYTYTDQDRLQTHTHQIGESGIPQLLAKNEYDELGQLIVKRVGGTDLAGNMPLQKVDYAYNIRGWLKEINRVGDLNPGTFPTDLFAFKINYDTVENTLGDEIKPLYNGNIAETFWRTESDNQLRSYGYKYDALNRLTRSVYQKNTLATNAYNEEMGYDRNGNIQFLKRNGAMDSQTAPQEIDDLVYTYDANKKNQLMNVYDDSISPEGFMDDGDNATDNPVPDYAYDDNGNMNRDDNKGITAIVYNHLNLPTKIVFGSEAKKIEYIYNAAGTKVVKSVTDAGNTVYTTYLQGFQYKGKSLLFFPTAGGYVNYIPAVYSNDIGNQVLITPESYNYVFNYTDHLGNIRLSYGVDPSTQLVKIIEENHYYPFGLKHTKYNTDWNLFERVDGSVKLRPGRPAAPLEFKYKYNGKEFQDELGLNMTAMDYRQYDNAIGRFNSIDALAEVQYSNTPYHFGYNNPVYWADPTGLLSDDFINSLWNNSANNSRTTWTNQGGMFMNQNNSGMIDGNTGEFTAMVGLPQVDIIVKRNNWQGAGAVAQMHTYKNSSFYDSFWKDVRTENMNGFQREMDGFGSVDPTGVIDGLNALIYSIRGQKTNAAIAALGIIPYIGDAAKVGKYSKNAISAAEFLRIENAATRIGKPITVVGSRASGTAKAYSDWDYVIEGGINSKNWSKIKNSLPGAKSTMDNMSRNIDIFTEGVKTNLPHITINPR